MNAPNTQPPRPWTAWFDYVGTGEGRVVMACIAYVQSEEQIRKHFAGKFGDWYALSCHASRGVVRNSSTEFLWSCAALNFMELAASEGGMVDTHAILRINRC